MEDLNRAMEAYYGDTPSPELMELCREVSFDVMEIMRDPDLWFRLPRIDLVRLMIQERLVRFAAAVVRMDRQEEGPSFFGTVDQEFNYEPAKPKPPPPLRSWVRRNGRKA